MWLLVIVKSIEVIGEVSTKVCASSRSAISNKPRQEIRGMRKRLIHGYDQVDCAIVWKTLKLDLPPFIIELDSALAAWPLSGPSGEVSGESSDGSSGG